MKILSRSVDRQHFGKVEREGTIKESKKIESKNTSLSVRRQVKSHKQGHSL